MSGNRGSTKRMDLQLAAYAAGKDVYTRTPTVREMFPRKRITTLMQDNGRLTQVMNNLRHSAHRTQESQTAANVFGSGEIPTERKLEGRIRQAGVYHTQGTIPPEANG